MSRRARQALFWTGLLAAALHPCLALAQDAAPPSDAQALFKEAASKLDARDFEHACPMLEKVLSLEPGANGARLALAECYEGAGRLASAHKTYVAAADAAAGLGQTERQKSAKDHADALEPRLGGVIVQVSAAARSARDLALTVDGQPLGGAALNKPHPLDKGAHEVVATAAGKKRWARTVQVTDGATVSLTVDALEDETPSRPPESSSQKAPAPAKSPPAGTATRPPAEGPPDLSHRGQFGAFLRADIDVLSRGAVAAPGITYAPLARMEIGVSALLGRRAGFEAGLTFFFLTDRFKPLVTVSVPVIFQSDPYAGIRGAAGLQVDLNRHVGLFATIGGVYFPDVPRGYSHAALLPALGVQGRL